MNEQMMGRQTCQPDFAKQISGANTEVIVEEYKEIDRVKDIHNYQKTKDVIKQNGPLVKEKDAFKVPDILTKPPV